MVRQRVRIRFRKQGDLRLIGHRDLVRCLERLFRRAGLPLGMSEGFHPKPRMSFPRPWPWDRRTRRSDGTGTGRTAAPPTSCSRGCGRSAAGLGVPPRRGPARRAPEGPGSQRSPTRCRSPPQRRGGLAERIDRLLAAASCPIRRDAGRSDRSICVRCWKNWLSRTDVLRDAAAGQPAGQRRPARRAGGPGTGRPGAAGRAA